jgi:CDP-glycerol glycerophosphotransferase (TagB/SpsB family)
VRALLSRCRRALQRLYYKAYLRLPIDENLAVYCAYEGRGVRCNPGAIYEKAKELAPHVRGVWIVKKDRVADLPDGVGHVVENSFAYFRVLARAKYLVNNTHFAEHFVKRPGSVLVQTHHGTPLKFMGVDGLLHNGRSGSGRTGLLAKVGQWDFSLAANPHMTASWRTAYPGTWESLEYGYPRNDILSTATAAYATSVRAKLAIEPGRRVILYLPTHRGRNEVRFDGRLDVGKLAEALGEDTVILLRTHYFYDRKRSASPSAFVVDVSDYPVVEDLYLAADILITDYSSAMFDFAVLDRPIVVFASDWTSYRRTRGVYFDIFEVSPGVVVTGDEELIERFRQGTIDDPQARAVFRRRFCALEDGRASERVVRRVFLGETAMAAAPAIPHQAGRQMAADQAVASASVGDSRAARTAG